MKRVLAIQGVFENSPKSVVREAAKNKLISKVEPWFEFLEYRKQTSHTYDEKIAEEIYSHLNVFINILNEFVENIKNIKD